MPNYKLYYFNMRGRAEPIRLFFKVAEVDFEDKRLTFEEWGEMKSGLAPSTNLEKAQADMICEGCSDLGMKLFTHIFEKDEARKAQLIEEGKAATPVYLKYFEDILRSNGGGKGFLVGDRLTYADIILFNFMNHAFVQGKQEVPDELNAFPLLAEHYKRVMDIPNIKKWMAERPTTEI